MVITHKMRPMYMTCKNVTQRVDVMQDDKYSRRLEIPLRANGDDVELPEDVRAVIRYQKPDGTGGNYDTLPDGSTAYSISGNVITVALAPQVCTVPGVVQMVVCLMQGNAEINTFVILVNVHRNPGIDAESQDYTNMRAYVKSYGWPPDKTLRTDADGNVIAAEITTVDTTLTQSGQAADAATVGERFNALSEEIVTTAESKVSAHNTGTDTHSDIRLLISGLTDRLNALADSDDATLDQLSEVVAYIKNNRTLIEAITTDKVSVADIVDNLTTNVSNKPLSAAQGVALKALIDGIVIPDKLPNPNVLTFTGAVEATYDGGKSVEVVIPQGWSEKWELISDITTEEEVGEVVIENISLKKVFIQAAVVGTTRNGSTINGQIKINGFAYFYANSLSFNTDSTRFTCSFVEVIGDSKRHQSAALNNNTYQANSQQTGWFGDGTPINTVVFNAASANGRVFGIGSNFKIWGLK